ncbi:double zinc ribbon domain-containing protein [Thalassorhabdomicrobium marinisediminis]|uniref:double zinc ribbon domain-containing protein n=1 Tax=Thalassorhabdomicrobium marinisediminis TaxID=2170577 RepID=UPI002493408A|nr:double zinc ribbon domain-containing protein [Thalassorhabdomicrobium marinisediminis]
MQSLIKLLYPPQCALCDARTDVDFALCGSCWAETPFIEGLCCNTCGAPLPGVGAPDEGVICDDCMKIARPWSKGRAVMRYGDLGRRFVLGLKHADRTELARSAGPWLARAARDLIAEDTLFVPIPLHRMRLLKRRYNQAALLAQAAARAAARDCSPNALIRPRPTLPLDGHSLEQRFATLSGAIVPHPRHGADLAGRRVLLVDDVMTSGATFAAATEACFAAGAADVCVLALARVGKET